MEVTVQKTTEKQDRPQYEKPRIQEMTERDILNSFQVTQAMQTWWGSC